jgi:acyl-coenzyme A synthetase/AMP-(fatty) acid ligase
MSLIGDFARIVAARPRKVALITEKSQLTFEDLRNLVIAFDIELTTRGVRPGQTLVMATARAEFCLVMAILMNLRSYTVIFAPVAPVLAAGIAVDRYLVVKPDPELADEQQIVIEPGWFSTLGTMPVPDYAAHEGEGGTGVFQSSGTTGVPKYICRHVANRAAEGLLRGELPDLANRRLATTIGGATAVGQKYMLSTILAGGSVLALGEEKDKLLPYVDLYRVDTLATTPAAARMILDLPEPGQYLASMRSVSLMGAPAGPQLLSELANICPARICVLFGTAEIGSLFEHIYDPGARYVLGQLGRFLRDDLEIGFYDETHALMPEADEGIVGFRPKSGAARSAYLKGGDDALTGFKDGVFFSGDIMRREGTEYFITGRVKNIVNFSGNKVSLDLVREVLEAGVPGATLVPLVEVDESGLERLAVITSTAPAPDPAALTAFLAPRFKGLKVARVLNVGSFPITETGKIDMQALKAMLAGA